MDMDEGTKMRHKHILTWHSSSNLFEILIRTYMMVGTRHIKSAVYSKYTKHWRTR